MSKNLRLHFLTSSNLSTAGDHIRRALAFLTYATIVRMVLLENDAFLAELTKLFDKSRLSGSVSLTIKRFNGHNKPVPRKGRPPLPTPTEYLCLVRASLRNKKISTVIHSKDVNKFQQAYWNLLKTNVSGLKKLKKTKSAKPKVH
ncbi:PREDICTED: signal recognition particle 14 kDa protein [Wasmannia auropunctata]|uniref:signal recognition particle 14 kDa protein n=1 Tax=Wasmannia auropunctata TaxID=64793 RepID=UPI0005EEA339|nr:PREDICTED: signal recognition particle 14 kDa protein [Wasmannia auropunctata]